MSWLVVDAALLFVLLLNHICPGEKLGDASILKLEGEVITVFVGGLMEAD